MITRLDLAGVEYLLEVARQIGFECIRKETSEDLRNPPTITLQFEQRRTIATLAPAPEMKTTSETDDNPTVASILGKQRDRLLTLDDL